LPVRLADGTVAFVAGESRKTWFVH
jgi:hypothetical protein